MFRILREARSVASTSLKQLLAKDGVSGQASGDRCFTHACQDGGNAMADDPQDARLLQEMRDLSLRQLEATERLLVVQREVTERQKKTLRLVLVLLAPLSVLAVLYLLSELMAGVH